MLKLSCLVCAAVLLPGAALAASPFDGTWKVSAKHIQVSKKPSVYVITDSSFTCSSCAPPLTVKADGADHKVTGFAFDTAAATVTPTSVSLVLKLNGKPFATRKTALSSDGKTATSENTFYGGSQPDTTKSLWKQVVAPAAGENPLSGSWVQSEIVSTTDAGMTQTLGMTDDGFTWSSNGMSYDAKFDGKKYLQANDPTNTMVTVKKLGPSTIVESDYEKGKLNNVIHMTVSADGKTLRLSDRDVKTGRTTGYLYEKQP